MNGLSPVTPLALWKQHWRDIKLLALDWRYYQHQTWEVKENDLYCLTRQGPALFQVMTFEPTSIRTTALHPDDTFSEATDRDWQPGEFTHGGFSSCRLHIPQHLWEIVAQREGLTLQ